MNLHKNKEFFQKAIDATAKALNTQPFYVEKDYYVVKMLKNIAQSPAAKNISFKGGTSLSKAYKIIERFSEDVDMRVYEPNIEVFGGGVAKRLYRAVEAAIPDDALSSMGHANSGTSLREQRFSFHKIYQNPSSETLPYVKLEQNYQSSFLPMQNMLISSYVGDFLKEADPELYYRADLTPFSIPTLCPKVTFAEKLGALEDYYYQGERKNDFTKLVTSVRHLYDLHKMTNHPYFQDYLVKTDDLKTYILQKRANDRAKFITPSTPDNKRDEYYYLTDKTMADCSLYQKPLYDFAFYLELKAIYESDFKQMVFGELPDFSEIEKTFTVLSKTIQKIFGDLGQGENTLEKPLCQNKRDEISSFLFNNTPKSKQDLG